MNVVLHDFGNGDGPIPARKHKNGGGWVSTEATVHPDARIENEAMVIGRARLGPQAVLRDQSSIVGDVQITGEALLEDRASIKDRVRIDGAIAMSGSSTIGEDAWVQKDAILTVSRQASMRGDAIILNGETGLDGMAVVAGFSRLSGNLYFSDAITVNAELDDNPRMIIKGMHLLDFILDEYGVIWFCVEGRPIRFDLKAGEYDDNLKALSNITHLEKLKKLRSFLQSKISH
ncbi:hypothetical protein AB4090_02355 [Acidithiobacillus sp. IBUN Pt1247-S3]|uniref:hypothetical protein n=1 Tax=Acidithiobacillus sp. IBUN Pt1247-S3 TaxID=3166642 RepID=UPI0034E5CF92